MWCVWVVGGGDPKYYKKISTVEKKRSRLLAAVMMILSNVISVTAGAVTGGIYHCKVDDKVDDGGNCTNSIKGEGGDIAAQGNPIQGFSSALLLRIIPVVIGLYMCYIIIGSY